MALTVGSGPFGHAPSGHFDFDPPTSVTFVEVFPRRVRALKDDETVVDSDRVRLVYRTGALPRYAFPAEDVSIDAQPEPAVDGYVTVAWDAADRWLEEADEVIVHPRDPYHRIDTLATRRRAVIRVDGEPLADSTEAVVLFEIGLPPRYYLPRSDVRMDRLQPSPGLVTGCPYKGFAGYFDAPSTGIVAWTYTDPLPEVARVRDRICFFQERDEVELELDGVVTERPPTPWSNTRWAERFRPTGSS